ncbi:MAG: cyclopropane-fatty-acyl-phospholipid synthase family protein [Methylocella sp.]
MDHLFKIFFDRLIRAGSIEVETAAGHRFVVGDGAGKTVVIRFADRAAQISLMLDPELHFGELFMDGRIEVTQGSVYDVLMLAADNLMQPKGWVRLLQEARLLVRRFSQVNDKVRARNNVAHHYDLDAGIYTLFLDSDLQYSCAYFEFDGQSLEDAQLAKKRHIAAKLLVEPGQRVLDIGSGFGGTAIYLARFCEASVTGLTLSKAQFAIAEKRAADLGLSAAVDFRLLDYREIDERFDRIVSTGMFEHVGLPNYDAYFQKIAQMLDEDGVAFVHTIGRGPGPAATNPWIAKYIFPGGYIPALSEILPAIERAGLIVTDIEMLRLHYAETLRIWRERFMARRKEAKAIYDERFCRMWEFYLAGSETAFRRQGILIFQIQLAKKLDAAVPYTRDYISRREADLRQKEESVAAPV